MAEPTAKKIKIACSSCGQHLDVTDLEPFVKVECPTCKTRLLVPMTIGNYQLLSPLGSGGMGTVYKAYDSTLQRFVAVKLMKKEMADNRQFVEDFTREARAAASLNHPNIAQILSFGQVKAQYYLVMELLEGGSLDNMIERRKRVPELEVLEVGIQVASALKAANQRGLIHRDIKPGNILFNLENQAKVVDFGLARFAEGEEAGEEEEEEGIWGTPYYIAPEKLNGEKEDFRSDMYSLGGTLFHALAGRPPFEADTATEVVLKHLKSPALSLKTFAPDICDETAQAIGRMLRKNREERFESYDELITDLQLAKSAAVAHAQRRAALPKRPVGVIVSVPGEPPVTKKGLIGTLVVLAACIAAAFAVWHFRGVIFGTQRTKAVAPAKSYQPAPATWFDLWEEADNSIAKGDYDKAVEGYRKAKELLPEEPAKQAVLSCQIGTALNLKGKPTEAVAAFKQSFKEAQKGKLPDGRLTRDNYAPLLGQLMSGALKLDQLESKLKGELPWAWTLAQFYLGAQALGEGRYADAAKWLADYAKAPARSEAKWTTLYQPHAKDIVTELGGIGETVAEAAKLRMGGKNDEAAALVKGLAPKVKTPLMKARLKGLGEEIKKEIASLEQSEAARKRQALDRIGKLREQFLAEVPHIEQAAAAVPAPLADCNFEAAAEAYESAAAKIETQSLKQIATDRATIYRRLHAMKTLVTENMAKSPYTRPGLTARRGNPIPGRAAAADRAGVTFVSGLGQVVQPWGDLSPLTILTLLTYYSEVVNAQNPNERASNFVALAWLSRDLKMDQYSAAYAANAAQLNASTKAEWDKLIAPLPPPPDESTPIAEQPAAATAPAPAPPKTGSGSVTVDIEFQPVKKPAKKPGKTE